MFQSYGPRTGSQIVLGSLATNSFYPQAHALRRSSPNPRRRNDLSTDLSTPVDNSGRDLMLLLNENDRRESLLPKKQVKNCIAGFSVWLTSGGKISLTKNSARAKILNRFHSSLQGKNSLSRGKKLNEKNFPVDLAS